MEKEKKSWKGWRKEHIRARAHVEGYVDNYDFCKSNISAR